ncbi:DUF2190 family protein [Paucibacter sp. APW11]|uniref:DUF2190 family protein n=1 Tax=Roseateles aquae TaxID=3077235 RepID=A0ABU3P804_9BURK|nr:DUF2190 family protein [Paucibacter sp. APW11]MDT8998355.1 DUF2190 family protein [Paucibacter sp. APW11]
MAGNFKQEGDHLDYTPGADTPSGSVILIGTKVGVALTTIKANTPGAVRVTGVWTIAKLGTDVVAQGAALYWDNTNKRLTVTAAGNTYAGYAAAAAGSGVTTVDIKINC